MDDQQNQPFAMKTCDGSASSKPKKGPVACDRDQPIMLIFYQLCYAAVLKILTYYARYYAHVKNCA